MDIKRYAELKASGNISLQEIQGKVFVVKKDYDPEIGDPKDPHVLPVDKESFLKHKADAQEMIDAITLFLDDVEALENKP